MANKQKGRFIGSDECGYGSLLGPLVVTAVSFEMPLNDMACIPAYKTFKFESNPSADYPICDSKLLFGKSKRKFIKAEKVVLAFLNQDKNILSCQSTKDFFDLFIVNGFNKETCKFIFPCPGKNKASCFSLPIPFLTNLNEKKEIEILSEEISHLFKKFKISFSTKVLASCPNDFNSMSDILTNKASLVNYLSMKAVASLAKDRIFVADVGRNCSSFTARSRIETMLDSQAKNMRLLEKKLDYSFLFEDGSAINFLINAEARSLEVALASMIGKYCRDLLWKTFIRSVFPNYRFKKYISGYRDIHTKAFVDDVMKSLSKWHINKECFIRNK